MTSRRKQIRTYELDGACVLDLGAMDIWDGADLALLRDSLSHFIQIQRRRRVGIDMSTVKHVPSGFFGMLYDWHESGVEIVLIDPLPHIRRMLWFRQFAAEHGERTFLLTSEIQEDFTARGVGHWRDTIPEGMTAGFTHSQLSLR